MTDKTVFALGFFDGVHLGHQALLSECKALAERVGCRVGVVTFLGHPDELVSGRKTPLINTPEDRRRLLKRYGVEEIVELPFDRDLMHMHWQDFYTLLRRRYHAVGFVCGQDFRFGSRGEGNAERLQGLCVRDGLPCSVVPEQTLDGITVSSTHIRCLLQKGDLEQAEHFLGHRQILTGTVVAGKQLGRRLGTPTANLTLPAGLVELPFGVYICRAKAPGLDCPAVTNIGIRPTVAGDCVTVEPWLLDFEGDLYGQELTLEFYKFLRPERKFPSLEELRREIIKNAEQTLRYFKEGEKDGEC
jgi:riboflavin kinase/FMN adenylyltransferase